MRILDAEDHQIYVSFLSSNKFEDTRPMAVAVVINEGNFSIKNDANLLGKIRSAQRRVKGNLVAQNLSTTTSDEWFLLLPSWRISRIAVQANMQGKRIGSELLKFIRLSAKRKQISYLSTSFGLTSKLVKFWNKNGFDMKKIGARKDTSSGEHSGVFLFAMDSVTKRKINFFNDVFKHDLQYLLKRFEAEDTSNSSLPMYKSIIFDAIKTLDNNNPDKHISSKLAYETNKLRISQYVKNQRSFSLSSSSFYYFLEHLNLDEDIASNVRILEAKQIAKSERLRIENKLKTDIMDQLQALHYL